MTKHQAFFLITTFTPYGDCKLYKHPMCLKLIFISSTAAPIISVDNFKYFSYFNWRMIVKYEQFNGGNVPSLASEALSHNT